MNLADDPARKRLIEYVLYATTLDEIASATQMLNLWMDEHPDDLGMVDGYELLANLQEAAEEHEAERGQLAAGRAA